MSYCLTKCLKMVLDFRGDHYDLPFLECASTEPFGFVYVRRSTGGLAINGYEYDRAGERLLELLGYEFEVVSSGSRGQALLALRKSLQEGPVVLGMLDMGFLTYQPDHRYKMGTDHAIVALGLEGDAVVAHDPAGYVNVRFPLEDLLKAWKAEKIYTQRPNALWRIGPKRRNLKREELFRKVLELGLQNLQRPGQRIGSHMKVLFGGDALRTLAVDVRAGRAMRWIKRYAYFSLRVSGQRCFDSAAFIRSAPFQNKHLSTAADVRFKQTEHYGKAQWAAASKKHALLAEAFREIAELEDAFTESLRLGLSCE